jgi:hypothetical protein
MYMHVPLANRTVGFAMHRVCGSWVGSHLAVVTSTPTVPRRGNDRMLVHVLNVAN